MGLGMEMPGTLEYTSPYEPVPLTELEEALLLVAGTGLTGLNLGDIDPSMGADAMVQWTARTWPSSCSNHGTELFFTNDDGTWFLDMWNLMPEQGEISTLQGKPVEAQVEWILELVRGAKKRLSPERAQMPTGLPGLFVFNHWNANKPGTTLFLPVSNMTLEYINLLFIYFSPEYRFTLVDETNGYAPCGLQRWIDSGRLDAARQMGIVEIEQRVLSMQVVEQAFICQNINLALQAMGLGGWTYTGYIARYALGGMDVPGLGFRFAEAKRGPSVPVGRDGVFEAFVPPYHDDMGAAVDAFLERKWSQYEPDKPKAYLEPDKVTSQIERPAEDTIQIVKDYCQLRPRDLRALPGLSSTRCTSASPARPSTSTRTSTPSTTRRARSPTSTTPTSSAGTPRWPATTARRRGAPAGGPGPGATAAAPVPPGRSRASAGSRSAARGPAGEGAHRAGQRALGEARAQRRRQRALQQRHPAREGVALGAGGGQLGHQAVALGAQGLGVSRRGCSVSASTASRGIRVRWAPGSPTVSPAQAAGLQVAPDRALGDPEGLGGLGDGDGVGGG